MNLIEAIEEAAGVLPEGYVVRICVERGSALVELEDLEGNTSADFVGEGPMKIQEEFAQAVDTACGKIVLGCNSLEE